MAIRFLLKEIIHINKRFLLGIFLSLSIGILIYCLFRKQSILHFNTNFQNIPDWIIYNLPDGLWTYSFTSFNILIWKNEKSKAKRIWILLPLIISLLFEVSQYILGFGTFDNKDIIWCICGYILSMIFYSRD